MKSRVLINDIAPYIRFSRHDWKHFREDAPMTLSESEIQALSGINEPVSRNEVEEIYLPLARLLNLYVDATQQLYNVSSKFLKSPEPKVPYIIGVSGSVGVGKSTTSRVLKALLNETHRVEIVNTDSFLLNNQLLEERNLMNKKGFPESYHLHQLIQFLVDVKSGNASMKIPVYSHYDYDIKRDQFQTVSQPDILILEGLNILQERSARTTQKTNLFISDFLDFTVFVDAQVEIIKEWFIKRFMFFRESALEDPQAFFYQFRNYTDQEAIQFAENIWTQINEANLKKNILPFKDRAKLILTKGKDHIIQEILLRKI